jgi:hypothetical protein
LKKNDAPSFYFTFDLLRTVDCGIGRDQDEDLTHDSGATMRGIYRLAIGLFFIALSTFPVADRLHALQRAPQGPESFSESVDASEPVGASAAMGAVLASGGPLADMRRLTLHFKQPFNGTVVVQVTTADGRYRGTASYRIANARADATEPVLFPTKQLPLLSRYTSRTVAISAHSDGVRAARRYFPVSFDGEPGGAGTLLLYVMSQGADVYFVDRVERRLVKCERVTGIAGIKFDTVCRAPAGHVDWSKGVSLRRVRGTTQLDPISVAF